LRDGKCLSAAKELPLVTAYINRVASAVPPHEIHETFTRFAHGVVENNRRDAALFRRMAGKSGIDRRYSCLAPHELALKERPNSDAFYRRGAFPGTAARMRPNWRNAQSTAC